ncbi:DUF1684 domain-containing protein [Polaribacter litorisediminis]|uniref:DUF1684 domain-containing protein n=1 Tax=Polaribacter litorisediminis TaxID=1908341 RepID=UPI001CBEB1A5|nr:DUF1684 domain-containing protein [Polaribacter litorisediminis]UAM98686.1 DUF1684 domain-containing protein [Polaribacter litorisediminis]
MKFFLKYFFFFLLISCNSGDKRPLLGKTEYQQRLNANYKDASKSPLKKKDLKNFKGLDFFPVDDTFIVAAKLIKTENAPTFEMATNTDRKAMYKEYGVLKFSLKGKDFELTVYKSQDELEDEKYKDDLYLAFTDNTSGNESYGAGRYMDLKVTDEQLDGTIILNFNNTYNPYCAYNEMFSCPLTPKKNHLDIEVKAGIKVFKNH